MMYDCDDDDELKYNLKCADMKKIVYIIETADEFWKECLLIG